MKDLTKQVEDLTKRVQEAELETSLVKAVGINSPEMRALKKELNEVKEDNKKLANQINEMISRLRDANF
jgi:predicted  nucleic acid-binding Zn-ribbon protein